MFEGVVAPIAVALAFDHARRGLGARRAAGELLALAAYGFTVELVAMSMFASHAYAASWWAQPLGVPLAVASVWAAVIVSAMAVSGRHQSSRVSRAVTAAVVAIALDLLIDPVATRAGLWRWTPPGPWLGVPIGNFVAWGVIVGFYAYGADRWAGTGRVPFQPLRRFALAAGCIVVLVMIAELWTRLGLERLFEHGRGWMVWAAVQVALLWRVGRIGDSGGRRPAKRDGARWGGLGGERGAMAPRRRSPPSLISQPQPEPLPQPPSPSPPQPPPQPLTLPMLLAETPGWRPEAALCVVGVGFAIEALSIAQADVTTAAVGSLAALAVVAARLRRR